ncbi:hypothetical protein SDC9_164941 [bioreactor metagenome]|uniref:Uncharacterized protein n=1 Tax=bioreactor metagenome TaxID=1076179 RepID=A0A645FUW7_9ZZZZ
MECSRKLGINAYFFCCIQVFCKSSFDTLFGRTIGKHIVLNGFLCKECFIKTLRVLFGSKDSAVIFALYCIVRDMLHNHCCLLLIDKPDNLCDKFLRVVLEHIEFIRSDTLQDG